MCLRTCPLRISTPRPKSSTPTLLEMVVRFFTPLRAIAAIRFSGMPLSPKPPNMITAPSCTSRMASSALATTLFMISAFECINSAASTGRGNRRLYLWEAVEGKPLFALCFCVSVAEFVAALELRLQFRRAQVFADVGQPLLQPRQRLFDVPGVGQRDVAPHGVRTSGDAG